LASRDVRRFSCLFNPRFWSLREFDFITLVLSTNDNSREKYQRAVAAHATNTTGNASDQVPHVRLSQPVAVKLELRLRHKRNSRGPCNLKDLGPCKQTPGNGMQLMPLVRSGAQVVRNRLFNRQGICNASWVARY